MAIFSVKWNNADMKILYCFVFEYFECYVSVGCKYFASCCLSAGGVAGGEDAREQLHCVLHARRHAPEGEERDHEGVPLGGHTSPHHHRRLGQRSRRATGWYYNIISPHLTLPPQLNGLT